MWTIWEYLGIGTNALVAEMMGALVDVGASRLEVSGMNVMVVAS